MNALVLIPARGGSKGVPGKNSKLLGGKPLIHYTIDAAKKIFPADRIVVSTDDAAIKKVAENAGIVVPFLRPDSLATDEASTADVITHALEYYRKLNIEPEILILLQPTSPFRTADHIREAMELYRPDTDMVVSVKETQSNPYYILFEENTEGFLTKSKSANFTRRQDCPKVWEYNGAIYIINVNSFYRKSIPNFDRIIKYEMDERSSHDIDTIMDWQIAEFLSQQH